MQPWWVDLTEEYIIVSLFSEGMSRDIRMDIPVEITIAEQV